MKLDTISLCPIAIKFIPSRDCRRLRQKSIRPMIRLSVFFVI